MTWNYRVFETKHDGKAFAYSLDGEKEQPEPWTSFDIREVHYNKDGEIWAYTEAQSPYGETPEELKADISMYLEAFKKPVIDKDSVKGSHPDWVYDPEGIESIEDIDG
mgnify:CR=1 FL=1|jgi:hypothetical protein